MEAAMRHRVSIRFASAVVVTLLACPAAQADPRGAYIAALVAGASAQRDVQAAEAGFTAARQARSQLEASLRAATAAEDRMPGTDVDRRVCQGQPRARETHGGLGTGPAPCRIGRPGEGRRPRSNCTVSGGYY
jgi:hypothetical protein